MTNHHYDNSERLEGVSEQDVISKHSLCFFS